MGPTLRQIVCRVLVASSLLLAACGGGSSDVVPPTTPGGVLADKALTLSARASAALPVSGALVPQSVTSPSAACHVSDGKFTICPSGQTEWSDVAPIAFPETNSYLYASQSDQSAFLKTKKTNLDTFMLLYDECNRTTSLGPDEYVLVNFKTVEVEDGKEKLVHYVVHLFADGTLIVIEDGKPNPAGRTKVIEGQRGAVGFGPSPKCPTPHVIAEYEIQLSAASSHSYSPDPLFWGSSIPPPPTRQEVCGDGIDNNGDGQIDEGCPSGIRILNIAIAGVGPTIEINEQYNVVVTATVSGSGPSPVAAGVIGDEKFAIPSPPTRDLGDRVLGETNTGARFIPRNTPSTFTLPGADNSGFTHFSYQHTWRWMGNDLAGALDQGCLETFAKLASGALLGASTEFLGVLGNPVLKLANGFDIVSIASNVFNLFETRGIVRTAGVYDYLITASNSSQDTGARRGVLVRVPPHKLFSLRLYLGLSAAVTFSGFLHPALPVIFGTTMCHAYRNAVDPDSNFRVIATLGPTNLEAIDGLPASPLKDLARIITFGNAHLEARVVSLARYEGAKEAGDREWMLKQLAAARAFHAQWIQILHQANELMPQVILHIAASGFVFTPEARAAFKARLLTSGLSAFEKEGLTQSGFSSAQLANLAVAMASLADYMPSSWEGAFGSVVGKVLQSESDMTEYLENRVFALSLAATQVTPEGPGPSDAVLSHQPAGVGYDPVNNRMILYFASNPSVTGVPNEVWVITNANGFGGAPAWKKLDPIGTLPNNLNGLGSTVYDETTNRLIVYGGCLANCSPAQSSVYVLSNANGLGGVPVWTSSVVTNPQARADHSAVFDSGSNRMIAFGGHFAFFGTDQNDTRILSNANGTAGPSTWTTVNTVGGPPPIRGAQGAVYDRANNRMIIFGGQNLIRTCCPYRISGYNDTWVLSNANGLTGTPVWTKLETAGTPPTPRAGHSAVYDPATNRLLVLGGSTWSNNLQDSVPLGDFWALSNANGLGGIPTWTQLAPGAGFPLTLRSHSAVFDPASQRMIVFGGVDETGQTRPILRGLQGAGSSTSKRDSDGDGVPDELDNCPGVSNPDQKDSNLNGIGNTCETPGLKNATAGFLQALDDGRTSGEALPVLVNQEPQLVEQITRIVKFRMTTGLTTNGVNLTTNLINSLIDLGVVSPQQESLILNTVLTNACGRGDIDCDGDVDQDDVNILLADRNRQIAQSACGARCDLDSDGRITALDARALTLICTRARCATK